MSQFEEEFFDHTLEGGKKRSLTDDKKFSNPGNMQNLI